MTLPKYVKELVKSGRKIVTDRESPRYNPSAITHKEYRVTETMELFGDTSYWIDEYEHNLSTVEPEKKIRTYEILCLNHVSN